MSYAVLKKQWDGLSFQHRLTIGLSGLFGLILTIGYYSLFVYFQEELQIDFNRSLYNYAEDLLKNTNMQSLEKTNLPKDVFFSIDKIFPFPHGDALVKVYRKPSEEVFSYTTDKDAPRQLDIVFQQLINLKDYSYFDLQSVAGDEWRGILLPMDQQKFANMYFFVAVPSKALTDQISKFRSLFIAGHLIILAISALMISVLSKGLLNSLHNLTQNIRDLSIHNSSISFAIPSGPPEVAILANKLNQLITKLKQSLLSHQEFVSNAAHQLKTPLTIAKGHLEQVEKELPPHFAQRSRAVSEEIDFMSGTINNLLALVQIESGFQKVELSEINILDQILLEVDHLDFLAKKKQLKFQIICSELEIDAPENWLANTDRHLLSIILTNLLENSIKYSKKSPIELHLQQQKAFLLIRVINPVADTMNANELQRLTQKFVRGTSPEVGQGLGLYIVYRVATILGIEVELQKIEHCFEVTLKMPTRRSN